MNHPHTETLLASLTKVAADIAREVGLEVHSRRQHGINVAATKSSVNDVVTEADHWAEHRITELLSILRPDDGVLGEEGTSTASSTGITWVVDPIDGTVNYLYDLPAYGVSIAATVADTPGNPGVTADGRRAIAGAVYLPATRELFSAFSGGGAHLNGSSIRVSTCAELSTALVATGFGYTVERRTEQAEVLRGVLPQVRDIRRIGAASVDLCWLAAGRLDAYYERGLQPWDYAAGILIALEAGAVVLGRPESAGAAPGESLLVAGPPQLAEALQVAVLHAYSSLKQLK